MKILSLIIISVFLFSFGLGTLAQETELPDPGVTPDSPFYFFERIFEGIGTFFTFGDLNKAARYVALASERMAEAKVMADREKPEAAQNALARYESQLNQSLSRAERAKNRGEKIEEVTEKVAEATTKHLSVLDEVLEKVPEEAKEGILKAKQTSMEGHKNALRGLAGENPEKAAEIGLRAAGARLDRAKVKAEEGEVEAAEEAVNEFKELRQFGEEISQIAQGLGKDTTTVEQLVGKATSIHLKVLAEVYEKVPEQAKPAIEKAMEVSAKGHQEAVKALKEKGALDEVPEEIPMSEKVPPEVKERVEREAREEIEKEEAEMEKPEVEKPEVEKPEVETPGPGRPMR